MKSTKIKLKKKGKVDRCEIRAQKKIKEKTGFFFKAISILTDFLKLFMLLSSVLVSLCRE